MVWHGKVISVSSVVALYMAMSALVFVTEYIIVSTM